MVITFFGHSNYSSNSGDEQRVLSIIERISQENEVDFYHGGYGGFDSFALQCAKKYKQHHSNAKIIFITPYLGKWLNDRKEFITKEYDAIIYPKLEFTPHRFAIIKRNEWMVKQSNYVFGYVKNHYGGAYRALLYAHNQKVPYINLFQDYLFTLK